jgi:hypothetical protein
VQQAVGADETSQIVVCVLSQRGWVTPEGLARRLPGGSLTVGNLRFTTEPDSNTDVVIIQNYLRYDTSLWSRRGFIWKWDNEPIVNDSISRGYDRVFTHLDISDSRVTTAPPVLDWWVGKTYDELERLGAPDKPKDLSAIASTKDWIAGHRARAEFIQLLEEEIPRMDIFGKGRPRELEDKWDGLAPYRYSIAIENTSKPDYWTEKISDCFLSYTVPFYFGATNIDEYFPDGSYIWLPIDQPAKAIETIKQAIADDDWKSRLPLLTKARRRVLERYSFYAQVSTLINQNLPELLAAPRVRKKVKGRRTRPRGWIRGEGVVGNIQAEIKRRQNRRSSS